jgi:hypothetical protein
MQRNVIATITMMAAGASAAQLRLRLARPVVDDHRQRGERTCSWSVNERYPAQQRAGRSLRPGARTLHSRHSVLVQVAGNGVLGLASMRSRTTRAGTSSVVDVGRPRTTPWSRRTASASRVRLLMKSRSSSAKTAAMCAIALPVGLRVSMPISVTISRQSCSSDIQISRASLGAAASSVHLSEDQRAYLARLEQFQRGAELLSRLGRQPTRHALVGEPGQLPTGALSKVLDGAALDLDADGITGLLGGRAAAISQPLS